MSLKPASRAGLRLGAGRGSRTPKGRSPADFEALESGNEIVTVQRGLATRGVYPNFNRPPPFGAADGEEPSRSSVSRRDSRHCRSHSPELCNVVRYDHLLYARLAAEL